ncbi:hypothetical protein HYC85_003143 [Camellia sinensis]|uniref:Uncharacterized protein n=1 Tax=Camellia sinensis TaxID=4442 RepID=A0A7J7IBY1_CAMSI|nr:hypothetical protein HYC85_003143 [Camellia sinensis]
MAQEWLKQQKTMKKLSNSIGTVPRQELSAIVPVREKQAIVKTAVNKYGLAEDTSRTGGSVNVKEVSCNELFSPSAIYIAAAHALKPTYSVSASDLFDRYSENGIMTVDHLHRFLIEVEGEDKATKEDAESIMESLNELKHLNIFHRKGLHLEAFFHYLFSDSNPPLSPSPKVIQTKSFLIFLAFVTARARSISEK